MDLAPHKLGQAVVDFLDPSSRSSNIPRVNDENADSKAEKIQTVDGTHRVVNVPIQSIWHAEGAELLIGALGEEHDGVAVKAGSQRFGEGDLERESFHRPRGKSIATDDVVHDVSDGPFGTGRCMAPLAITDTIDPIAESATCQGKEVTLVHGRTVTRRTSA